jgi:hypothetical protein
MSKLTMGSQIRALLKNGEYDAIHEGIFVLECTEIQLIRQVGSTVYTAKGPGRIWSQTDGLN